jgi:hypothetical protein
LDALYLVQAEVAARLAAIPGKRDYGYLSVGARHAWSAWLKCRERRSALRRKWIAPWCPEPRDAAVAFGITDTDAFTSLAFPPQAQDAGEIICWRRIEKLVDRLPEAAKELNNSVG